MSSVPQGEKKHRHELRERICDECRRVIYSRATCRIVYCDDCMKARRAEQHERSEAVQKEKRCWARENADTFKKRGYRVEFDPCDAPLAAGLFISEDEKNAMLDLHTAVPGMILSRQRERYQVVETGRKLKLEVVHDG